MEKYIKYKKYLINCFEIVNIMTFILNKLNDSKL